jgi:hypothetical protein
MPCFIGWPDDTALRSWDQIGRIGLQLGQRLHRAQCVGLDEVGLCKVLFFVIGCQILPLPACFTYRLNPSLELDRVLFPFQTTTPRQPQLARKSCPAIDLDPSLPVRCNLCASFRPFDSVSLVPVFVESREKQGQSEMLVSVAQFGSGDYGPQERRPAGSTKAEHGT